MEAVPLTDFSPWGMASPTASVADVVHVKSCLLCLVFRLLSFVLVFLFVSVLCRVVPRLVPGMLPAVVLPVLCCLPLCSYALFNPLGLF